MASPTTSQVHINKPLTNFSIAYIQSATQFVHGQVFPFVPVEKQTDLYFRYNKGDALRGRAKVRSSGNESAGMDFDIDTDSYSAVKKSLHHDVGDDERKNQDTPINLDRDAVDFLSQAQMITREEDWFDAFFKTGVWATDIDINASSIEWDLAGSDPILDLEDGVITLSESTGQNPMDFKLTLTRRVWGVLKNHPEVIDRIKYTETGIVTESLIASLIGIGKVLVSSAISVTARKGSVNENVSAFIGEQKGALLSYSPASASLKKPCAGKIFTWNGLNSDSAISSDVSFSGVNIKKMRMELREADRIESNMAYDMKVVTADAAVFFTNVIT